MQSAVVLPSIPWFTDDLIWKANQHNDTTEAYMIYYMYVVGAMENKLHEYLNSEELVIIGTDNGLSLTCAKPLVDAKLACYPLEPEDKLH